MFKSVPCPKQQEQNARVRWLTTVCQSGHSTDETGTSVLSKSVLPEPVSCPNLFYLLTILCRLVPADHVLSTDVLSGVVLSTNSTSCRRQQKILRQYSCSTRELYLGFLRACFWAFIFGALGRWTELWSRLGQARCVGVMAALPQPSLAPPTP